MSEEEPEEEPDEGEPTAGELPPLPDPALGQGVLPRVIKSLVERRGMVKRLMKVGFNAQSRAGAGHEA